jgi:hypothetical protein
VLVGVGGRWWALVGVGGRWCVLGAGVPPVLCKTREMRMGSRVCKM